MAIKAFPCVTEEDKDKRVDVKDSSILCLQTMSESVVQAGPLNESRLTAAKPSFYHTVGVNC